ncbi:MAG: hypothetical protein HY719_02860, partial [Planctomycetes bacterium]|nr:hypothetical protein [Planctomycetota bacterium]
PLEAEALLARWKESGAGASGPAGPAAARAVRCDLRSDAPVLPLAGKATLRLSIENGGGAPLNVDFSGGAGSDPARARLVVTYVLRDEFGAVAEVQETLRVGLSGRYLLAPGRAVEAAIPFRLSDDVRLRAVVVEAVVRAEARAAHGFEGAAPSFAAFTAGPVSVRFADAPFDDLRRDLPATLRLITDPRQLLSAAAATPAERRADAADALVAALERGPSPLTRAACAALAMLAGAEAGRSPDEWRDWWADNRETWRARDLRLRGEEEPGPTLPTGAK